MEIFFFDCRADPERQQRPAGPADLAEVHVRLAGHGYQYARDKHEADAVEQVKESEHL